MAVTHQCKNKRTAKKLAKRLNKHGVRTTMHKLKRKGYAVHGYR